MADSCVSDSRIPCNVLQEKSGLGNVAVLNTAQPEFNEAVAANPAGEAVAIHAVVLAIVVAIRVADKSHTRDVFAKILKDLKENCRRWCCVGELDQGPSNEHLWVPLGKQLNNNSNVPQPTTVSL